MSQRACTLWSTSTRSLILCCLWVLPFHSKLLKKTEKRDLSQVLIYTITVLWEAYRQLSSAGEQYDWNLCTHWTCSLTHHLQAAVGDLKILWTTKITILFKQESKQRCSLREIKVRHNLCDTISIHTEKADGAKKRDLRTKKGEGGKWLHCMWEKTAQDYSTEQTLGDETRNALLWNVALWSQSIEELALGLHSKDESPKSSSSRWRDWYQV